MRRICLLLLFSLPLVLEAQDSTLPGIKFVTGMSWAQIKEKAKAEQKYIFVDCYTTWCGPCKLMDRDIYTHFRAGYAMNEKFISVKVQMDSTVKDNENVKNWYSTARFLYNEYDVDGYPTFLFFSPDGKLVHKDAGFRDLKEFIRLSEIASNPQKILYYLQYDAYKRGDKDYLTLGELALFTKTLIEDVITANRMAKDYKEKVLDSKNPQSYSKVDLDFISFHFPTLVNSKDKFFSLAYNNSKKFDSINVFPGAAKKLLDNTISREEIETKLFKNGKYNIKEPRWAQIESRISRKYKRVDSRRLILEYQVGYYRGKYQDWKLWAHYKDELIKAYPPKPPYNINDVYIQINGWGGAWLAFMNCNDTTVLKTALEWADLAIVLQPEWKDAYLDTKANILYKLGKTKEAIRYQEEAILAAKNDDIKREYQNAVHLMKKRQPTYLHQGAIWDFTTLPKMQ
jgi:thioredoxin-related protein